MPGDIDSVLYWPTQSISLSSNAFLKKSKSIVYTHNP